jgi:glucose-1-phosphate thymidylyltransferase
MKGVILAGGRGTRLFPLTKVISKQLLPVYDKPLIYYPLSTLMLAGIRDVLIITTPDDMNVFKRVLGNGSQFGIQLSYKMQPTPEGLAQGIILAEDFLRSDNFAYILGDNIFHGSGLGRNLERFSNVKGAQIFGFAVAKPNQYGVVQLSEDGNIIGIEEKPQFPKSNLAVTGLYFYDNQAVDMAKDLKPSPRGELEITDLNLKYLGLNQVNLTILPRGTAWLDTGTFEDLHDAATFVRLIEERTGDRVGDPSDVARTQGWI